MGFKSYIEINIRSKNVKIKIKKKYSDDSNALKEQDIYPVLKSVTSRRKEARKNKWKDLKKDFFCCKKQLKSNRQYKHN